ncbi:hypothetical protein I3843_07G043100 [Carya illinoinensis]|nr:hypothetical protein I3843_07G043100 [Carya illinoinensis]
MAIIWFQKHLGFFAFSTQPRSFISKCRRTNSKKICSVMAPQLSERLPPLARLAPIILCDRVFVLG